MRKSAFSPRYVTYFSSQILGKQQQFLHHVWLVCYVGFMFTKQLHMYIFHNLSFIWSGSGFGKKSTSCAGGVYSWNVCGDPKAGRC